MSWKILKNNADYQKASERLIEIFHAESHSPEYDELELLLVLIKDYDDKFIVLPDLNPLEVVKIKMKELGLKSKDLEPFIGTKGHVSAILSGKREITLKMAQKLRLFLGIPAEVFFSGV